MALPLVREQRKPRIVIASAAKVDPSSSDYRQRRNLTWQQQAFVFVKLIPELNYASRFYAKMLSRLRIFPALRKVGDEVEPIKTGPPVDLLNRIQDPGGGRSQMLFAYGRLMFIAGDGFLFGRELNTANEHWSFINRNEVIVQDGEIIWRRYLSGMDPIVYGPDQAVLYRMWTPDPERSGESESPMRAALQISEELDLLTKAVRATAVSRMLNGMLKVPAELSFGSDVPGLDDDPEEDQFLADIIDHITGVIENAGTAEAASPFVASGANEFLQNLTWVSVHDRQTDYMERDLRKEAIDRLAMGLDLPPEVLKGFAQANHWGTRQIQIDTWRSHGAILAQQFCADLCEAYLRPALRDENFEQADEVVISFDDSNVIITHDRSDDADKAFDRGQVNSEGYRQMKSIPDAFAPSEEDERVFLAVKLRNPTLLEGTRFELKGVSQQGAFPPGPEPSGNGGPPVEDGPPLPKGPADGSRQESRSLAVEGAARFALLRCRQVAGARIRQQFRKQIGTAFNDVENEYVAAMASRTELRPELDPQHLVKGGSEGFVSLCKGWGIEEAQAKALAQTIEVFSGKTLFEDQLPLLPAGVITAIQRACEISDLIVVQQNNESLQILENLIEG
jgi:hypothetical protein